MINIIGLGPGSKESLTIGTIDILRNEDPVYFRTEIHPTIKYIKEMGIEYKTFDKYYEDCDSFDEVYKSIAKELIEIHKTQGNLIYGVPGHPLVAEKSVSILKELCKEAGIDFRVNTAVSFIDVMMERLEIDPIEGIKIIDAFDMENQSVDSKVGTIITQVYDKLIASEVKYHLSKFYDDEKEIIFVRAAGIEGEETIRKMPLYELDWQEDIDYLTSIYIPKDTEANYYDFNGLVKIIETLRGEDGCPWDREQTHKSIKNELIEECFEVISAIENDDDDNLAEELGDVLLHVVFHSVIAKEDGYFNENDVIKGICRKMISRHPHVFKDKVIEGENKADRVLDMWEDIKKEEKGYETVTESMESIANSLPSLMKAKKVQKKAARVKFDFDNVEQVFDKVIEELEEIKEVYKSGNMEIILEEIGDLLFSVVNLARFLNVEPEEALNFTIHKFIKRFKFMEQQAIIGNKQLGVLSMTDKEKLWQAAKEK